MHNVRQRSCLDNTGNELPLITFAIYISNTRIFYGIYVTFWFFQTLLNIFNASYFHPKLNFNHIDVNNYSTEDNDVYTTNHVGSLLHRNSVR
jgi:hypothetical protein